MRRATALRRAGGPSTFIDQFNGYPLAMAAPTIVSPEHAVPLVTPAMVHDRVPKSSGIYAAWVLDAEALGAAGIDGPAPRCIYVGKAERAGLAARLKQHVTFTFQSLNEILAARGLVLFDWGDRFRPPMAGKYRVEETALARIAASGTRSWQHQHLRWSVAPLSADQVRDAEKAAILDLKPLLNITHGGRPLPQLRACSQHESVRARWLWHASWLGLLLPRFELRSARAKAHWPQSDTRRRRQGLLRRSIRIAARVDPDGFLVPMGGAPRFAGEARNVAIDWPTVQDVCNLLEGAAAGSTDEIQSAVAHAPGPELLAWWAAHAGAPYLGRGCINVRDAIAQSLLPNPAGTATESFKMPAETRRTELLELVDALNRTRH